MRCNAGDLAPLPPTEFHKPAKASGIIGEPFLEVDSNADGTPDFLEIVPPCAPVFRRGDDDGNGKIDITDVSSSFAMEQMKYTTQLPLDYLLENND